MTHPERIDVTGHWRRVRIGPANNWHYERRYIQDTTRTPHTTNTHQPQINERPTPMTTTKRPYPDINTTTIVGRLHENPHLKTVGEKNTALAELAIVVNNPQGPPSLINIDVWAGGAQAVHNYTRKGDQIVVTGRLRTSTYTDSQGQHTRTYIDAGTTGVQFVNKPNPT